MKIIEENSDEIVNVQTKLFLALKNKTLDPQYLESLKISELAKFVIDIAKNMEEINESLQSKSVNNEFIEMLKEKINTEIDGNPALFEEFSSLLARISIAGKN